MLPSPAHLGALLDDDLVVADVGARWGTGDRWRPFGPRVRVIGFDPDAEECRRLQGLEPDVRFVPAALGAHEGTATLHTTVEPACSSLFPPVPGISDVHPVLEVMRPTGTTTVDITTLDGWLAGADLDEIHVMKLDTQGAELAVLEGATDALAHVRFLEVEVELNPLYEGQPLFGDIDRFLRGHDFVLWRLGHLVHYGLAGSPAAETPVRDEQHFDSTPVPVDGAGGQVYWAHAYYLAADALDPGHVDRRDAVRDACAATAFGFGDLARHRLRAAGVSLDG